MSPLPAPTVMDLLLKFNAFKWIFAEICTLPVQFRCGLYLFVEILKRFIAERNK